MSIRYAKENDREKREKGEREKERQIYVEREGEIREIGGEREREREREREEEREREIERESEMESKILVKSPNPRNKAQTKDDNTKLSLAIISRKYQLVYYYAKLCRAKVSELQGYWRIQKSIIVNLRDECKV